MPTVLNIIQHWEPEGRERNRIWLRAGFALLALAVPEPSATPAAAESAGPELPATGSFIDVGMVRLSMFVALVLAAAGATLASVGGYLVWQRKET